MRWACLILSVNVRRSVYMYTVYTYVSQLLKSTRHQGPNRAIINMTRGSPKWWGAPPLVSSLLVHFET